MWRDDNVGQSHEDGTLSVGEYVKASVEVVETGLMFDGVECGASQAPLFKRGDEGIGIHQHTASGVYQHRVGLHERELGGADHVAVFCESRRMERHNVGFREQLLQLHVLGLRAHVVTRERVACQHSAAESGEFSNHARSDGACAHYAHGAGSQAAPKFAFEPEVLHSGMAKHLLGAAEGHQHEHDGVICNAFGRIGGMGHAHAERAGMVHINVVVADGTRGDGADAELVIAVEELGRHGVGDDGERVRAGGERGVLQRGVFARPVELDVQLMAGALKVGELVERAQGKREDLHSAP